MPTTTTTTKAAISHPSRHKVLASKLSPAKKLRSPLSAVATWCPCDEDMEPRAKMHALVEQLRIPKAAGDKTIVDS
jgi:hypothetical protein